MSYSSASAVAAYCLNLLDGNVTFGPNTAPTLAQVNNWLSAGCSIIESRLAAKGYEIPVASTLTVYGRISDLNTLFGAARAEITRTTATVSPGERTRGQIFEQMFWDGLKSLVAEDLTLAGLTRSSQGAIYVGGISQSVKDTYESDSDRVEPRFWRGQFKWPETSLEDEDD